MKNICHTRTNTCSRKSVSTCFFIPKNSRRRNRGPAQEDGFIRINGFRQRKAPDGRVQAEEDSPMIDMRLIDFVGVATSADLPFRVVAIARNSETIIPSVDTKFKYHDLVFIMSKREGIDQIMKYIGKSNIEVDKLMILGGRPIGEMVARQLKTGGLHQNNRIEKRQVRGTVGKTGQQRNRSERGRKEFGHAS